MKRYAARMTVATILAVAFAVTAMAQAPAKPLIPVKVQVVIARYEGDKKVSSLPYTLSVTANSDRTTLRIGSQVPVPQAGGGYNFMNVGTNIDSTVTTTDDGRYRVQVNVSDSSVVSMKSSDPAPTLRNFSTENSVILKDGQTTQFTAAADKTTGEVVRIDVTLTVEK